MFKYFILCFAVLLTPLVFGQAGKLKRADNFYNTLAYAAAAGQYEGLVGSEVDSPELQSKLAYCYLKTEQFSKAQNTYAALAPKSVNPEDIYHYAQVLKINGDYKQSDEWMKQFATLKPEDSRSKQFLSELNYKTDIEAKAPVFEVSNWKNNSSATDFGIYPDANTKQLYFLSSRFESASTQHIWAWNNDRFLQLHKALTDSTNEVVQQNVLSRKVNTRFHEGPICFHPSGKWVVYTRNNISKGKKRKGSDGIQNLKMYVAEVKDGAWVNEREFPVNSKDYSVGHPAFSIDGNWLYFVSDMPGGLGGADLYKVSVLAVGNFGAPSNLGSAVNTEGNEMFPWISQEGHMYFSSDGKPGLGGLDNYVWLNDQGQFTEILNCGSVVNSSYDDFAMTTFKNGMEGYFSSNRPGGKGGDDIYHFVQKTPYVLGLKVKGVAKDLASNTVLPNTMVYLLNAQNVRVDSLKTDDSGAYNFVIKRDESYQLTASKADYFDGKSTFNTINLPAKTAELTQDVTLEKDPGLSLYGLVADSKTGNPLEGVMVKITDKKTGEVFIQSVTGASGDVTRGLAGKKIGDALSYDIELSKEGYFPKKVTFNTVVKQPGIIRVNEVMKGALTLDPEVKDLRDLIVINDIRFDYNKFTIRPDAAKELDKVVAVMNKYPTLVVELGSHTDCRGSIAYNEKLSDNRAKASAAYIKAKITNPERIYGKGYGESKLLNGCACEGEVKSTCSEEEHQQNRRTEFRVISFGVPNVDVKNNSSNSFGN